MLQPGCFESRKGVPGYKEKNSPRKYKVVILAKILWLSLFGLSQITKLQYILCLPKTFSVLIYKAKIDTRNHSSKRKRPWREQSVAFTGHHLYRAWFPFSFSYEPAYNFIIFAISIATYPLAITQCTFVSTWLQKMELSDTSILLCVRQLDIC